MDMQLLKHKRTDLYEVISKFELSKVDNRYSSVD